MRLPFAVDDFINGKGWRFQVALFIKGDLSGHAGVVNGAQGGQIVGGIDGVGFFHRRDQHAGSVIGERRVQFDMGVIA